jgi:hypothetical protein
MVSATLDLVPHDDAQPTSSALYLPPMTALSATVVQLTHECGKDGRLAGAFRELIG